ncbi:hypothetical protein A3A37_00615 [Candidatus Kaiserbacteria bacterium RIFCSPLOWO2_01_FULL_52_36]|nr:MAG: hypothetical protein A3A37_00615 [Candidatus Kaiserbacteria bacterium RIFCSPLOWO2_01_FULL_52_36]
MKISRTTLISLGMIALAVITWGAVVLFANGVRAQRDARLLQIAYSQEIALRENISIRLHALARDTKSLREKLEGIVQVDVLGIVNMIEGVGKITGVKIKINDASPGASWRQFSAAGAPLVQEINFLVDMEGSFPSLMHTAALFEKLPTPSYVQSLELGYLPQSGDNLRNKSEVWHGTINIRALSASDVSS